MISVRLNFIEGQCDKVDVFIVLMNSLLYNKCKTMKGLLPPRAEKS